MGFTSVWHWLIVLLVIVLLFGAKKIPELAKGLGSGIKNFKKAVKEDDEEDINNVAIHNIEKDSKVSDKHTETGKSCNVSESKTSKQEAES